MGALPQILDEVVICEKVGWKRVRRYLRGTHPERGVIVRGFTGMETIEEKDIIIFHKYNVIDITPSVVVFAELPVVLHDLAII